MIEDTVLTIFHELVTYENPLTKSEISGVTGLSPQLINYWIPKMVRFGILLQDDRKRYEVQPILKKKKLIEHLYPLIQEIANNLKLDEVDNIETAIEKCIGIYLIDNITTIK